MNPTGGAKIFAITLLLLARRSNHTKKFGKYLLIPVIVGTVIPLVS